MFSYFRHVQNSYRLIFVGVLCCFFIPVCAWAYTSVIANPESAHIELTIASPRTSQEFFGRLDDFPHTFVFEVKEEQTFKAAVAVRDAKEQKNDISVIIVKAERRGVSEIGRTHIKDDSWESTYSTILAESFRTGGTLEGSLQPGWYKLEVSSPSNDGTYRMVWGAEEIDLGYFENVRVLFEVKRLLGRSVFSAFLSPLLYVPLFVFGIILAAVLYRRRKNVRV